MKIIWVGDAACSSGFARCTHAACDALVAAGHEVVVLGINHYGDPHGYPYQILPCWQPLDGGTDAFGVNRLPRVAARYGPDVVVLLQDPWNVPAYLDALEAAELTVPVVGWLAVDAKNQLGRPLNRLAHVVTWTQFAADELAAGGYTGRSSVVPLGVDREIFHPRPRGEARARAVPAELGLADDAFIVGVVGRNQPRKRLDLALAYFDEWLERSGAEDAYLYLHVAPTGDKGVEIRSLTRWHGPRLAKRVILAEPEVGQGASQEHLAHLYASFDVYLATTQGEGWGLPCLEAMATGVPCIVPDWSGLGDWAAPAAYLVPCSGTAPSAPQNGLAYTVGGVMDREAAVAALDRMYREPELRARHREAGLELAARPEYQWAAVGEAFREQLERLAAPWRSQGPGRGKATGPPLSPRRNAAAAGTDKNIANREPATAAGAG